MKRYLEIVRSALGEAIYYCTGQAETAYSNGAGDHAVQTWKDMVSEYRVILNTEDLIIVPRKYLNLVKRKDIGRSAMTIVDHLTGSNLLPIGETYHPMDKVDFECCARLLRDFPDLRERLPEMAEVSPTWAALVSRWDELEEARSLPRRFGGTNPCKPVEALLQEILQSVGR